MKIKLLPDYPYLYETHMHTNIGNACGRNSGAEMAAACKEYGYTGAFITDHNWGGNTIYRFAPGGRPIVVQASRGPLAESEADFDRVANLARRAWNDVCR